MPPSGGGSTSAQLPAPLCQMQPLPFFCLIFSESFICFSFIYLYLSKLLPLHLRFSLPHNFVPPSISSSSFPPRTSHCSSLLLHAFRAVPRRSIRLDPHSSTVTWTGSGCGHARGRTNASPTWMTCPACPAWTSPCGTPTSPTCPPNPCALPRHPRPGETHTLSLPCSDASGDVAL